MKSVYKKICMLSIIALASIPFVNAQVKIGSNPTTIGTDNNFEIESSAGNKISVDKTSSKLTIKDGSQGANKILTSDTDGGASWQNVGSQRIAEVVFIGEQSGNYLVTTFAGFDVLKDRIPLVPRSGSLTGYNASTKKYVIQESGYYRVNTGALLVGTLPANAGSTTGSIYISPFQVVNQFLNINSASGPVMSVFWEQYLEEGAEVGMYVTSVGFNQNITVRRGFLSITKLF